MVNTINKLTERNKELLTKIEELESKKSDFQELISKVREWTGEKEGGYYTSHDLAEYYLVDEDGSLHYGWRKEIVDKFDTLEYVKSLIRATKYLDKRYWKLHWEKIEEINALEREKENSAKIIADQTGTIKDNKKEINKLGKELEEKEQIIKEQEEQLVAAKLDAETHYDFIGALQKLNGEVRNKLHEEIENNLELLEETKNSLEEHKAKVEELESEKETDAEALEEISAKLEEQKKINEELQRQIYLDSKPLPKIPSKFKLFKERTKSKFKQLQQLVKKAKVQTREFIAQIEVRTK
ncbi:MAG: hypothetical protein MRERV_17c008 [Mycoplasmataceae bacterium RV_VA103A]|nr:MAG: hypothetical protein MRERV_22c039 [Mycoplasmataceae bacterium RV_VA103A]KLL04573.1 MAG: hypothetical protein MRERV_17c008 [Mycoplasmataceae bacterium RV_VA103A]